MTAYIIAQLKNGESYYLHAKANATRRYSKSKRWAAKYHSADVEDIISNLHRAQATGRHQNVLFFRSVIS